MVQDTSAFNEIQMPYIVDDTLYLTSNVTGEPLTAYVNRVWPIAALSDTASITGENQGDVAFVTGGTAVAFRGSAYWNPFSGGGGGGSFNSFDIAGDTGSSTITDGQTVTIAGGYGINTAETGGTVTVTADTSQLATQNDISAAPSGTGTNQRIVVWTGTNSQGNSTQLQSAAGVTLDANLAYRITGGVTGSRPSGLAGMLYYNTSNNWLDLHNGTAWFNPARSATTNGLFTAGSVLFGGSDGTIQQDNANFFWDDTNNRLGIGTTSPATTLSVVGTSRFSGNTDIYNGGELRIWRSGLGAYNALAFRTTGIQGLAFDAAGAEIMRLTSTGLLGIRTLSPVRQLHVVQENNLTPSAITPIIQIQNTTTTSSAGFGVAMEYNAENGSGTDKPIGRTSAVYTTVTSAAEVSDFVISTMRAGTLTESLRSLGNGTLQIGTLSGTASKIGAFTSGNIATVVTPTITAGGTTGDRTINELAGTVNIAAAGTTVTVTNSLVTANSLVFCTLRTNDTTATVKNVVPTAGSFTINLGAAATGEISIGFFVVN